MKIAEHDSAELFPHGEGSVSAGRSWVWLLGAVAVSLAVYLLVFGLLRKPHTVGIYEEMISGKVAHFQQSAAPRLLLIGGSNVRCSHFAAVMEEELGIPSTNGGLTAELSPMLMFEVYGPLLRPGDVVYLPLEFELYSWRSRNKVKDYAYLATYGREHLSALDADGQVRALFDFELRDVFSSLAEMATPRLASKNQERERLNAHGDQKGYTVEAAERFRDEVLNGVCPPGPELEDLEGDRPMWRALERFLATCRQSGVFVIGGLPVVYEDTEMDPDWLAAVKGLYGRYGFPFLVLESESRYPREWFYNGRYHLIDVYAERHSREVAEGLRTLLPERTGDEDE